MKVRELKTMIKQSVNERVKELKEEFEHIELKKGTVNKNSASAPDGTDSGDKKMTVGRQPAPNSKIANDVDKVKEQKGAMNEMIQHEEGQPLQHKVDNCTCKVCGQKLTGRMNQAITDVANPSQNVVANARGDPAQQMQQQQILKKARRQQAQVPPAPVQEDVSLEVPLPAGVEAPEVSAQVIPGAEEGDPSIAELIIIDDQISPENVDEQMIEIEIPEGEGMQGEAELELGREGGMPGDENLPAQTGDAQIPGTEGDTLPGMQDEGGEGDEFDRMADLAGVKK